MANPKIFAERIKALPAVILRNAGDATARVVIRAGRTLARQTPVDTTKARSNWVAAIGKPDLSKRTNRAVNEVVEEIKAVVAEVPADSEVHLANGGDKVPYLGLLNNGSSRQAPAGFVQAALIGAVEQLESVQLLSRRRLRGR